MAPFMGRTPITRKPIWLILMILSDGVLLAEKIVDDRLAQEADARFGHVFGVRVKAAVVGGRVAHLFIDGEAPVTVVLAFLSP